MKNFFIFFIFITNCIQSQIIDKIVIKVGDEIILYSDIEGQYIQYLSQGYSDKGNLKCDVIQEMMYQKLLCHHAKIDSLVVSSDDVNKELDNRLNPLIRQLGSESAVEEYFEGKSLSEIKKDFFDVFKEQLLSQRMQAKITSSVSVTPEEVKNFFKDLDNNDQIPIMPTRVELSQIVKTPAISVEEKSRVRKKLISFRNRINNGEDLGTLASLYSDDTESAKNNGEIGFVSRGDLVPEFESVAFSLQIGEVSEVVETQYGFHILEVIERRGESINIRHILLKPQVLSSELKESRLELLEHRNNIVNSSLEFSRCARDFSDHPSANNSGFIINPANGSSYFMIDELPPELRFEIVQMNEGDVSQVLEFTNEDGRTSYRIVKVVKKIDEHQANLENDFNTIYDLSLNHKKQLLIDNWIEMKNDITYIFIDNEFITCKSLEKWIK